VNCIGQCRWHVERKRVDTEARRFVGQYGKAFGLRCRRAHGWSVDRLRALLRVALLL